MKFQRKFDHILLSDVYVFHKLKIFLNGFQTIFFFRIEFDSLPVSSLPREAVLVVQFCALLQNNDNSLTEKCLAWASKVLFNEDLYVCLFYDETEFLLNFLLF